MPITTSTCPSHHVWTDASGHLGCGAWWPSTRSWLQLHWHQAQTDDWKKLPDNSITVKELWGAYWRGSVVTLHCDNIGTSNVVISGYSRVAQITHLLRYVYSSFGRCFQITLWAVHVPGQRSGRVYKWQSAGPRSGIPI